MEPARPRRRLRDRHCRSRWQRQDDGGDGNPGLARFGDRCRSNLFRDRRRQAIAAVAAVQVNGAVGTAHAPDKAQRSLARQGFRSAARVLYSLLLMMWAAIVAREKRNKLLAARRGAQRGLVIITDRYPQNETGAFNDGPLLSRLPRAPQWLRRFETAAYRLAQRLPPDLVIRLDVFAETAARREPDMDPALVRQRITELQRLTFAGARIVPVDAEQPLFEVIRVVKREVWRML